MRDAALVSPSSGSAERGSPATSSAPAPAAWARPQEAQLGGGLQTPFHSYAGGASVMGPGMPTGGHLPQGHASRRVLPGLPPATKGNLIPTLSRISFISRSVKANAYSAYRSLSAAGALIPLLINAGAAATLLISPWLKIRRQMMARARNNALTFGGCPPRCGRTVGGVRSRT